MVLDSLPEVDLLAALFLLYKGVVATLRLGCLHGVLDAHWVGGHVPGSVVTVGGIVTGQSS